MAFATADGSRHRPTNVADNPPNQAIKHMKMAFRTDLRCQKCVAKITPVLDADPAVKDWSADVADPNKWLYVETDDQTAPDHVIGLLSEAGYTAIAKGDTAKTGDATDDSDGRQAAGWLATYRPLLLVLAYVIGLTAFTQWSAGTWDAASAMSQFMGFFFLGFAFFKLLNIAGFADAFGTYDIIAQRSRAYALAYPFIELALGLLYLSRLFPTITAAMTIAVMGIGLIGVITAVRKKQAIQCACLGTVFNLPMSVVTIVENSVMIVMATLMLLM